MVRKNSQFKCLVLYPEKLQPYFLKIYARAIAKGNGEAVSLAKILSISSRITKIEKILSQIHFVLADLTGRDKDVLFRAGLAHALGKPVGIIAQSIEDIPSDLQHLGYALYDTAKVGWEARLQGDISVLISEARGE